MSESVDLDAVLQAHAVGRLPFEQLFLRFGLKLSWHQMGAPIPGSFWGEPEAGLIGETLHARDDTPVQSILHEGCHWICLSPERRATLHTNVGGSAQEECAVCYLQILLAGNIEAVGRARMFSDMDAWGYSFRHGSASRWFLHDAEDARDWLIQRGLLCATSDRVLVPS